MTLVKLEGKLELGGWGKASYIGDDDIVDTINSTEFDGRVTVFFAVGNLKVIADDIAGNIFFSDGHRFWSEWTPGDPAEFEVGTHDFMREFREYNGEHVTLIVSDEPVDIGEVVYG